MNDEKWPISSFIVLRSSFFMFVDFHHVGIVVPNLDQGSQFYCDVFGFEVVGRFEMDTAKQEWVQKVTGIEDGAGRGPA